MKEILLTVLPFIAIVSSLPGRDRKIFGGREVPRFGNPFMAFIHVAYKKGHTCSGTILHARWILTAAHCVTDKWEGEYPIFFGIPVRRLTVIVGTNNVNIGSMDKLAQVRRVNYIYVPRTTGVRELHFGLTNKTYNDDIALLRLTKLIEYDEGALPIWITGNEKLYFNYQYHSSGWGETKRGEKHYPTLQELIYPPKRVMVDDTVCFKETWAALRQRGHVNHVICTETTTNNPCKGDSGGPLFVRYPIDGDRTRPMQIGVLAGAHDRALLTTECEHEFEAPQTQIWTRVSAFCMWILTTTRGEARCYENRKLW